MTQKKKAVKKVVRKAAPKASGAGLDLRTAYKKMLMAEAAYKQLGVAPQLLYYYRQQVRKGEWPKDSTMREHLERAGWECVVKETWRVKG